MKNFLLIKYNKVTLLLFVLFNISPFSYAQYTYKWMSVGSLHNFYSEIGSEIEVGLNSQQQYGLQWPAIHSEQDIQAAKGFWIGIPNFTDEKGDYYPHKVVHVGPRVSGANEFFPMGIKMISKFAPPKVTVDGESSYGKSIKNDEVDPNLFVDRIIVNNVNTQVGISMTRRVFQFGQQYHDNYIVSEYTFKNTGNIDGDDDIELNQTLNGIYFFYQFRLAVCRNVTNVIGSPTQWGLNTMNDARGDGVKPDPVGEDFRAQFMWHGKFLPFTKYDNIGGPIWESASLVERGDTVGRLGASQFAGIVTLHADVSATDKNDDVLQPSTTTWEHSDDPLTSNNDAYDKTKMSLEYSWMNKGHKSPRHADVVEPSGLPGFLSPTGDPSLGTAGGYSFANGYGPYTLAPGDSVTIVFAEGVSGISWEKAIETGRQYKRGQITTLQKNQVVFQGRDSLFQTFRRALANYESVYSIPQPPPPPKTFNIEGLSDKIKLTWETYDDPGSSLEGFEIYRAVGKYDSTYYLIYTAGANERSYDDVTAIRGLPYYYHILSVGSESSNNGVGLTPAGKLRSNRFYTQSYDPAILKRVPGDWPIPARFVGTKPGSFEITAGVNDQLKIGIDDVAPLLITLTSGTLSVNEVARQINGALGGVYASNELNHILIASINRETNSKVDIQAVENNAYDILGLSVGTYYREVFADPMNRIRIVPNPFNISAESSLGFGTDFPNRLAFYNIPGKCKIKIYSELGELITEIEHTDGTGDDYWDSTTSSRQIVVSGLYIAVFENLDSGEKSIQKFVIIR